MRTPAYFDTGVASRDKVVEETLEPLDALGLAALALEPGTTHVARMNASARRLLGAGAWLDNVHPHDRALVEAACKTSDPARAGLRVTNDNLTYRNVQLELRPRERYTIGVLFEVIEAESPERSLAPLLEALPFDVWERDADGVLIRQNSAAVRNWGGKLGEGVEGNVEQMGLPPETIALWRELNARALRGEVVSVPIDYEVGGRRVNLINLVAPVRQGDRISGIVGVNIDITATRAAEAERDAAQATLVRRERLAALGELAAMVAHEVRNPLAAIYNSLSTLKRRVTFDDNTAVLFRIIEEEASRLNRTVDDLLSYVRPLVPERRPDDLIELVREVVHQRTRGSAIEADVVSPAALDPVNADPVLLRVALSNLVTNAIQAMPDGGRLTVTLSDAREAVTVAVHDTGAGIPSDVLPRVFEPFFTTRATGAGLGLAVVRRIVEAHDGQVTAESDGKRGTSFTVVLPRAQP